jgi:hypothetical protein
MEIPPTLGADSFAARAYRGGISNLGLGQELAKIR